MKTGIDLGRVWIEPADPVEAGSFATIVLTYVAGHPIDDSGYLKIVFRQMGDFGEPQFSAPSEPNYCVVRTTGDCSIEPRWDPKGHLRPWSRALYLRIHKGFLNAGERVIVTLGDTSAGSPGWQMQSFCETRFEFKTFVDPIATARFEELPSSPVLSIIPGRATKAACIAPSHVLIDTPFTTHLRLEDRWGNPVGPTRKTLHPGFRQPGVETVRDTDADTGLSAESNPIHVRATRANLQPFWADFHGQSEETIGTNSIEEYFTFARDVALIDIASHQGNDFQVTDALWQSINDASRRFNEPGKFIVFPGYEWSGNTPLGGDRNVFFSAEGGRISRSCRDLIPNETSAFEDSPTATALFENLARSKDPRPFVFAHVGGRYADLNMHDPALEVAVEIHSGWGTFEWLLDDALRHGYHVGICANSDDHKGRLGAAHPGAGMFGSYGGLTCVLAKELTRECVLESLLSRHTYATTGNRCLIELLLDAGDGREAMMGDVIELAEADPMLRALVVGTGPLDHVEVRNGSRVIRTIRPYGEDDLGRRVKIVWRGAEVRGRDRAVCWDGHVQVIGNTIEDVHPINFWNADRPVQKLGHDRLQWQSFTTGGTSGVIITLTAAESGRLMVKTPQCHVECDMAELGVEPVIAECGGEGKRIEVCRLPSQRSSRQIAFELPLQSLRGGENPILIHVVQEDGHLAWTSPIYVRRGSASDPGTLD